eukprot:gnl/Dysnectes_brevis/590_a652_6040.p1 GENE.gnl/Dysnectes_brevis/590_a652_6040~~gnl/Dysnectes_brevis/590_a652_6040.p1  ORF type:complete len:504 (-),score=181.76 gnl/Dysnectes_brevis/590_a652_6040:57-1532(-)
MSLEPKSLWEEFEFICSIPHPSGHIEALRDALKARAESRGFKTVLEKESGNLLVIKPADPGYEHVPSICLQGHVDMVPSKRADSKHDWLADPIITRIEDGKMYATGTTLGADNGIGLAAGFALISDKSLKTGPIEVLITVDEETTMHGAIHITPTLLKSRLLLNLDSEDLGIITIGSAGGFNADFKPELMCSESPECHCVQVEIGGLTGGHSGCDIAHYRANGIKLMARLMGVAASMNGRLCSVTGGTTSNSIPMDCRACFCFPEGNTEEFIAFVEKFRAHLKSEFGTTDKSLHVTTSVDKCTCGKVCYSADVGSTRRLSDLLLALPNGPLRMSQDVKGLTETSSNVGLVNFQATEHPTCAKITCLSRSSVNTALDAVDAKLAAIGRLADAWYSGKYAAYGGWKPNPASPLLAVAKAAYEGIVGPEHTEVEAIHAGLEVGMFYKQYPTMDGISIGPTIRAPHSTDEHIEISTVPPFYECVKRILEHYAQQK